MRGNFVEDEFQEETAATEETIVTAVREEIAETIVTAVTEETT